MEAMVGIVISVLVILSIGGWVQAALWRQRWRELGEQAAKADTYNLYLADRLRLESVDGAPDNNPHRGVRDVSPRAAPRVVPAGRANAGRGAGASQPMPGVSPAGAVSAPGAAAASGGGEDARRCAHAALGEAGRGLRAVPQADGLAALPPRSQGGDCKGGATPGR